MKKILAFLLAFTLLLVPFSIVSYAETSSYVDVTLTSTYGWETSVSGDNWVLYLNTSGYTSNDWSYKYKGFNVEIDDVTATTGQVSSVENNRLYCTIPTSLVPTTDGTVFTIKAGYYDPDDAGTSAGLHITSDFDVVVSQGRLIHTTVIPTQKVEAFNHSANSFYFSLMDIKGNKLATGLETWDNFVSPSWCDETRVDTGDWASVYSGVFIDGAPMNYWDAHFKNVDTGIFYIDGLNAIEGTTVTVRGHFVSSTQAGWNVVGNYYLNELKFVYNGSQWVYSGPVSYDRVNLTSTEGWNTSVSNENLVVYLNTNSYVSDDWSHKYKGFTYEVGGVTGTTGQVSSTEDNRLYCTIPTSGLPITDGTIFTIKAGTYDPDVAGATTGLQITEDFDMVISEGRVIHTNVIDAATATTHDNSASSFYFTIKDENGDPIETGLESWTNFLSPAWCDGTRITQDTVPNQWSLVYSGVFIDGAPMNYWDGHFKNPEVGEYYIDGLNAVNGTTVTVRGHFASSAQDGWGLQGSYFLKEIVFTYDGSNWTSNKGIIYTDHEGTPVFDSENGENGFYFTAGETEFPYDAANWTVTATAADDEESGVFLNGEKTDVYLKKVALDSWYVCLGDAGVVPNDGDEITVAGTFIYENHRITFVETTFVYGDTEVAVYTGTPILSETAQYGNADGFYFTSNDGAAYAEDWSLTSTAVDGEENGVFVNGTKTAINLKKINTNLWYVCIKDAGVALNEDDIVVIKGSFNNGTEIISFTEAEFQYNGKNFSEGTYTTTDFSITGLAYSSIGYDATYSRWNMYFTLSNNIPGNNDDTFFPYLTYEINGTEYAAHWYKSNEAHTVNGEVIYNLYIPMVELPATLDQQYVITLKAGKAQGRNSSDGKARTDGIRLTSDYQFVIGNSYTAAAPAVDYLMQSGGNANGIYLSSNDDFPIIGWDYSLTKAGENDGIYVDGVATDVFLKKYEAGKYYVCLSDLGITAQEGTVVMLKGKFTTANLNFVSFQTAKYIYTDGQWHTYSVIEDSESTGVSGDGNGDGQLNIIDLVLIKKTIVGESDKLNLTDADMNGDGKITSNDLVLVRKLLLGVIEYVDGANITGAPVYNNTDDEMRLSAYVSPTVEEGFDDYKAAGFTTLISEQRAIYGTDGFDEYMNLAAEKGLDVLVQSGNLEGMLAGTVNYDQAWLQLMCDDLSKYESFRGLFMGDEPRIAQLANYTNVANALKTINSNMDLFTSCLPTYTVEEYLWADDSLSLAEKYSNYANAYGKVFGEFTYDFYPFKHSYQSFLGIKYNEKDYMRSDWFQNLTLVAANAKGAYDTGITVQSYSEALNAKDHYRDVTQADISFQVYSALAYGIKSINYFTYGTHWDEGVGTTSCMVYNGEKTDVYYAVQNVNREIKAFDNVLLNFSWQGTIGITGTNTNGIMNYVDAYTSKRISDYSASDDAIIGCLKDSNGYDGFMLVNSTDPSANVSETISVTFKNADHAKVYVNGVESVVELENGTYSATLTPGQGIFVIPYIA